MKIAIFGASGILGQSMRLCIPANVEPVWVRRNADMLHRGLDLENREAREAFLAAEKPQAIVNLAGESRPDVVERDPVSSHWLNTVLPGLLAMWCHENGAHYVHASTQAVFSGTNPPYGPVSERNPVNAYGRQKSEADALVELAPGNWTIARPTFVLGVRPLPLVGRQNPAEQMLSKEPQKHADDRWFSISFADEVAAELWTIALAAPRMKAINLGSGRYSRFDVAEMFNPGVSTRVSHDDFPGIAPRPVDTTYSNLEPWDRAMAGVGRCKDASQPQEQRARELSLFTGIPLNKCRERLAQGFIPLHHAVTEDFRRANPRTDDELLEWYRTTDAYNWELSAYHCDAGFNYSGMCGGVAERLRAAGVKRVLCLGDGIGDLTLTLHKSGFEAVYHDLAGSRTAAFAQFRFWMYRGYGQASVCTGQWNPEVLIAPKKYDAVVSFDFLEHVTSVPQWTAVIEKILEPGGLFFAQNAFACGSGPQGSIPMHLARNDRFEKDWDPMLSQMGFIQESSNWYRRAAA